MQSSLYRPVQFPDFSEEICHSSFRYAFAVHCIHFLTLSICLLFSRAALAPLAHWACLHFIDVTLAPVSRHPNLSICVSADMGNWSHYRWLPCLGLCHRERWCGARYAYHIFNFSKENNCSSLLNKVQYHFSNGGVKKQRKFGCFW